MLYTISSQGIYKQFDIQNNSEKWRGNVELPFFNWFGSLHINVHSALTDRFYSKYPLVLTIRPIEALEQMPTLKCTH